MAEITCPYGTMPLKTKLVILHSMHSNLGIAIITGQHDLHAGNLRSCVPEADERFVSLGYF